VESDTFYSDESLNANGVWVDTSYGRSWIPGSAGEALEV